MEVQVDDLERIFARLIAKLRAEQVAAVAVEDDYYWLISSDVWTDFTSSTSPEPVVGSLVDDWQELLKLKDEENVVSYVNFGRFASILWAIAEVQLPSNWSDEPPSDPQPGS